MNRSAWDKAEIEHRGGGKKGVDKVQESNDNLGLLRSSPVKYYFMLRFFNLL